MKILCIRSLLLILLMAFSSIIRSQSLSMEQWQYLQIDNTRQKWGDFQLPEWLRYFGLDFGDVNRDGYSDIVSGRYFYVNPGGDMTLPWKRFDLEINIDGYLFANVDGDAFADIIAEALPGVYWLEAQNRNGSDWKPVKIGELPATDHVNGQGGCVAQILTVNKPQIIRATGNGIYAATIPDQPEIIDAWKFRQIIDNGFDEGIALADNDGDPDVFCGELIPWDDKRTHPFHPVVLFINKGNCMGWDRQEIDANGCYRGKTGDIDNDGDIDLVAPRNYERGPLMIWFNQTIPDD